MIGSTLASAPRDGARSVRSFVAVLLSPLFAACLLTGCDAGNGARTARPDRGPASLRDVRDEVGPARLRHRSISDYGGPARDYGVGDLLGGEEAEILGIEGAVLQAWSAEGERLLEFPLPEDRRWRFGFTGDVDGDGRNDVVLGAVGGSGGRLLALNRTGSVVLDAALDDMNAAVTTPHFLLDDYIVFSVAQASRMEESRIGAFDIRENRRAWELRHPNAIVGVHPGPEKRSLGISSVTAGPGNMDDADGFPHLVRAQAWVLEGDRPRGLGTAEPTAFRLESGAPFTPGYPGDEAVSAVKTRVLDDRADAPTRFVRVDERMSELYRGPTEIAVWDTTGEVYARRELPGASPVSVRVFRREDDAGGAFLLVASERHGTLRLLDAELGLRAERRLPEGPHVARVHYAGDLNHDGRVDLVVSDNHRLFILDGDLETQYSTAFAGPVHDVRALPAEGNDAKRLLVVHDGVSTLLYGSEPRGSVELWVRPAGSRVQLGERSVSGGRAPVFTGLQPGSYRVKVRTPDGVAYEEELEVRGGRLTSAWVGRPPVAPEDRLRMDRFPPGRVKDAAPPRPMSESVLASDNAFRIHGRILEQGAFYPWFEADMIGGPGKEILYNELRGRKPHLLLDHSLQRLRSFPFRRDRRTIAPIGDMDGDGKHDLAVFQESSTAFEVYRADGMRLMRKSVAHAHGTRLQFRNWVNDRVAAVTFSYDALHPSGVYFLRRDLSAIESFYPLNGIHPGTAVVPYRDYLLIRELAVGSAGRVSYERASGGEEVVVTDRELALHILNRDGTPHRVISPLGTPGAQRALFVEALDLDGDGEERLYLWLRAPIDGNAPSILAEWKGSMSERGGTGERAGEKDSANELEELLVTEPGASLSMSGYRLGNEVVTLVRTGEYGSAARLLRITPEGDLLEEYQVPENAGKRYKLLDLNDDGILDIAYTKEGRFVVQDVTGRTLASISLGGDLRFLEMKDLSGDGRFEFVVERNEDELLVIGYGPD